MEELDGVTLADPNPPQETKMPLEIQTKNGFNFLRCDPQDADIQYIQAYYGILPSFDMKQLIC